MRFGFRAGQHRTRRFLCGFACTLVSNLFSNRHHIHLAEQYPTHVRGAAVGAAYAVGKTVTAALPFLLLPLLHMQGAGPMFATIAPVMLLLIVNVATLVKVTVDTDGKKGTGSPRTSRRSRSAGQVM